MVRPSSDISRRAHSGRQALARLVLELAAVLEQGGETLRARQARKARLAKK